MRRYSPSDGFALVLSLLGIVIAWQVATRVFENIPHIEDEMAYVWQAKAITGGALALPSPKNTSSFLVPFVVDYQGQRFGKYPPGWPAVLALGIFLGARGLVNPLLAGLAVWLTYRLGQRLFGTAVGLLAAGLTVTSPFFWMNSGSLLSHPLGLVLSAAFTLAWLDAWPASPGAAGEGGDTDPRAWLATLSAALCLGLLVLSRPLTAVALALPFGFHGLLLLLRGSRAVRLRLMVFGLLALALASLLFAWQFAVTGDPFLNPYTLWWEYDKVGFGPGHGLLENGHTLHQAWINTRFSLRVGAVDLFGWGWQSWLFLPFGLAAILWRRSGRGLLLAMIAPSFVLVYLAYWIGSWLYGPRYYYETLFSLTLVSAAGVAFLAGWPLQPGEPWPNYPGWGRLRPLLAAALVSFLVALNLVFFMPQRLQSLYGLYGISAARLEPFRTPEAAELAPALVIVDPDKWTEYGALLDLQSPFLKEPFLFVISVGVRADYAVAASYPDRTIIYYNPARPYEFKLSR